MVKLSLDQTGVLYMFERPSEPLYLPRRNNTLVYKLPHQCMPNGVRGPKIQEGANEITTVNISLVENAREKLPLSVKSIKRCRVFSVFSPQHKTAAVELLDIFLGQDGLRSLMNYAANIRDVVNESLFIYCLSSVMLRNPEYRKIGVPSFVEVMPASFIPNAVLEDVNTQGTIAENMANSPKRILVTHGMNFTGTNFNPENRVAYWREDYGINNHHYHWHVVFPSGMKGLVRDRKGEMFYYMHQQMLARYDMERLCHRLNRVKPLNNWTAPIQNGYYSKLTIRNSGRNYGTRQDNTSLSDLRCPNTSTTLQELQMYHQRILDGIHQGYFIDRNRDKIILTDDVDILNGEKMGIDILGETLEADSLASANYIFYGNFHNIGHVVIAKAHDPTCIHQEDFGVMGDPATAMRDPVFYRWHRFIDDIFQTYKTQQRPYFTDELVVKGLKNVHIGIVSETDNSKIRTFQDTKRIEASRGLAFRLTSKDVDIDITRINHEPFKYRIMVDNTKDVEVEVTARIFLAPKYNEDSKEMTFSDQRMLWSEMDKFRYKLQPGENTIMRNSTDSSITVGDDLAFKDFEEGEVKENNSFCECGWPQHALVPRGTEKGMPFQLFVLLSDYALDKICDTEPSKSRCGKAVSYCGLLDEKFPDKRAMGFPFDRRFTGVTDRTNSGYTSDDSSPTIKDFVNIVANSALEEILIEYVEEKKPETGPKVDEIIGRFEAL